MNCVPLSSTKKAALIFKLSENFRRDSAHTKTVNEYFANKAGGLRLGDDTSNAKFRSLIIKNVSQNNMIVEERFFTSIFSTHYNTTKQNWKLINKTDKILGHPVSMATTDFGGRNGSRGTPQKSQLMTDLINSTGYRDLS
ncbi:hypothetical protein [Chryseobacterium wanjuense]